jgi:hypothetical protein
MIYLSPKDTGGKELIALWIEDTDGNNERCIFFTRKEVQKMTKLKFPFHDNMVFGRLYMAFIYGRHTNVIKIRLSNKLEIITTLSNNRIKKLEDLAMKKYRKLIPKKSRFIDMLD